MIQARNPELVGTPFFARFDPAATWFTDLEPVFTDLEPVFTDLEPVFTDLEPVFTDRFPYEPAPYELPGFWPDEPGELMVPAI